MLKVHAHRVGAGFKPDVGDVGHGIHRVTTAAAAFVKKVQHRLRTGVLPLLGISPDENSLSTMSLKTKGVELLALREHVDSGVERNAEQAVEHRLNVVGS